MFEHTELLYNGKPMNPTSYDGFTLEDVAVELALGHQVEVDLQPGDATRYNLLLCPRKVGGQHLWIVIMDRGGDLVARYIVPDQGVSRYDVSTLDGGNAWSLELLHWYLSNLTACWTAIVERGINA